MADQAPTERRKFVFAPYMAELKAKFEALSDEAGAIQNQCDQLAEDVENADDWKERLVTLVLAVRQFLGESSSDDAVDQLRSRRALERALRDVTGDITEDDLPADIRRAIDGHL